MLTIKDLILGELSKRNTREIARMAVENNTILAELWDYAIADEEPLNWRSAWVIKGIWEQNPALVSPLINEMIRALPGLNKAGVKREFLRMIQEYPIPEDEDLLGILLDCCFAWLAAPAEPIAIKIHTMTILFEISKKIPEIKPELITTIEVAMQEGSAGIRNRGSKTISNLCKIYK
jgi:hypothetical protein